MTQQLASGAKDGRPLDFGSISFGPDGMSVKRGAYHCVWSDFTANDVTLSDVADDYAIPSNAPVPGLWDNKGFVTPDVFPSLVLTAFTMLYRPQGWTNEQVADRVGRLWNDPRASTVRETLGAPTLEKVDPNDSKGNFKAMVAELKATSAKADDLPLLTVQEEAAIAAVLPPLKVSR